MTAADARGRRREEILHLLGRLVAIDTTNPPREITADGPLVQLLTEVLSPGFIVDVRDHGQGCVSVLAVRGAPVGLFNFHLDTVPANPAWKRDPFALELADERAYGLGACDIKGAAAAFLVACSHTTGPAAVLFTTDEEAGKSVCVQRFLERHPIDDLQGVIVAEPTRCRAVLNHRGIATAAGRFTGVAGHASDPRALNDSAVHAAAHWICEAVAWAREDSEDDEELSGVRFNVGRIEGGTKPNMIATEAEVRFGVRPGPQRPPRDVLAELFSLALPGRALFTPAFEGPPLPAPVAGRSLAEQREKSRHLAELLGLEEGPSVDFWTEASLFSAAGLPALVYGPGDIRQAHTADEWVALADLDESCATYERILASDVLRSAEGDPANEVAP